MWTFEFAPTKPCISTSFDNAALYLRVHGYLPLRAVIGQKGDGSTDIPREREGDLSPPR